ncbi:hypothetical protein YQE_01938, partial [Dendroctonus ponderosae]
MSVSKESPDIFKRTSSDFSIVSIITSTLKKASVIGIVYLAGYMQWSVAWFIGPLVLSVIRDQWKKSSDRRRNAAKTAALSSEKDVVLARLNDLPAWVFFPDIERAEWLNRIMNQLWPSVNLYVKQIVRDSIQPALKENLEKFKLFGFKFERIILGTVPFRIGGVKVYDKNIDRNEIVMDLDIFYAGDCDITFHLSGLKGGIRDFQLHGMLRVVMKPLISSVPLIGGLQVFFLNNPDIDFNLLGVADVLDMPGLSDILRRIVIETVSNLMVLPNKFPIKLSEEVEAIDLKNPEPEGVLRVHVVEAKHLMKKDISVLGKGKSDPYAVVTVGAQSFKTKVIDNTVDPKWDFWCEFNILESNGQQLYIHLWDKDDTGDDESLGRATVEISNIVEKGSLNSWVTLEQAKHGMVHLRFTWLTLSKDYNDLKTVDLNQTEAVPVENQRSSLIESVDASVEEIIHNSANESLTSASVGSGEQLIRRVPSQTSSAGEAGLGRIQLTLRYSVQRQRLIVVVHKVANIPLKDPSHIPDPYVKLYLLPERAKDSKRKTQIIKDNCNPVFDETFEFILNQAELGSKQLEITVGTQKQLFSSNVLGQVIIDLSKLNLTQPYNVWLDLQPEE